MSEQLSSSNDAAGRPSELVSGPPSQEAGRQRGGCLTTYLVVLTLIVAFSIIQLVLNALHPASGIQLFVSLFFVALNGVSLYGLWNWKKWGAILQAVELMLSIVVNILQMTIWRTARTPLTGGVTTFFLVVIPVFFSVICSLCILPSSPAGIILAISSIIALILIWPLLNTMRLAFFDGGQIFLRLPALTKSSKTN